MIITFFHQIQVTLAKKGSGYYYFAAVASWESGKLNCIYYKQFDIFEKVIKQQNVWVKGNEEIRQFPTELQFSKGNQEFWTAIFKRI